MHSTLASIARLRWKVLVPRCIFHPILGTNCHIDALPHGDAHPERDNPSDIWSHALQFGPTSYLKPKGHRTSIRSFLQSSHRCMTSVKIYRVGGACSEALGTRMCIAEGAQGVTSLGESASNGSHPHLSIGCASLGELQDSSLWESLHRSSRTYFAERALDNGICTLGELASKLQNLHRWRSFRTRRWESLHGSFRHHGICSRQEAQAEDTDGSCGGVLKVQPPQMLQSRDHLVETDERRTSASLLRLAPRHCTQKCFHLSVS